MPGLRLLASGLAIAAAFAAPARAAVIEVTMDRVAYQPATITAHVGDTIEWTNKDFVVHTATARDKSFDLPIKVGGTVKLVLKTAGTIDYYCRFHPTMKGEIKVEP
ncbi:MAG TPA: cupredoxin domain-containing protein [Stellaceae bacterium]|nr:cupredoxin domain-containing protein [Stellaceae bacterium]